MTSAKPHIEMASINLAEGWEQLPGFPAGIEVKPLVDDLDEATQTGSRTRLVRFLGGARTTSELVHDYSEEVFVLRGDLVPATAGDGEGTPSPSYTYRPPGTPHGPFLSREGCILFEIQYYGRT
ncbi:cupin domain-containing protein [Azospirillum canadense]|uniref:cupin domain-containing protein n=1 Tax=Azospirillum canadense TaxID=403962 RepID=UPI002227F95D|nr:cupin domain-containing protein [Azospirillum canadense]MCW2241826.1 hypothetical protein [Azospirillum canadense]